MEQKKLKKYIMPTAVYQWMVGFLAFILMSIGLSGWRDDGEIFGLVILLAAPVAGWAANWLIGKSRRACKKYLKEMAQSGEMERVLSDFSGAVPMVKDKIRLGDRYIYGKTKGQPVAYRDICRVYQHIEKRNFVENRRTLVYVDPQGKRQDLCDLLLHGKSDEDMKKIMIHIKLRNPNTQLGYDGWI